MTEGQQAQGIFRIRRMTPEDLEQVAEIDQISFTQPWPRDSFKFELYNNPVARLWVAEKLPEEALAHIIGIMVIWVVFDEAHLASLAVHPDYRRLGIGVNLLQTGLIHVQAEGVNLMYLEVRRGNLAAQELYHRFGFFEFDVRKGYYQDNGEDALIYLLDHIQERNFTSLPNL